VFRRSTAGGDSKADHAVVGFDFNDQRAQHIEAEGLAALAILGIFCHGRGDVVVDPVAGALIVIIAAAATIDVGADLTDFVIGHGCVFSFDT
jgi:hypothetical protein